MKKIIIGVHGLSNKPPGDVLADWWKKSLVEGLTSIGVRQPDFEYRMVYWADLLYTQPTHSKVHWKFDMLYNSEPYRKAKKGQLKRHDDGWLDELRARAGGIVGDTVDWLKRDFGVDHLADWVLGRLLKDLAFYYSNREIENREKPPVLAPARGLLRNEVSSALKEAHAAGKEILLIAHSMGAIISYDALRGMGRERGQKVEIPNFVTISAPLGLPHVKHKILEEWKKRRGFSGGDPQIRTPSVVTKDWTNYSDQKDPVAADIHLADDYAANEARVQVRDDLVLNDYHTVEDGKRKENHHKSYGYLRTPEMAEYVRAFLGL